MREPSLTPTPAAQSKREKLAAFGRWCLDQLRGDNVGSDIDGGDAQDQAEALGLLETITVQQSCGEHCWCAEYYGEFPVQCLREVADD